MNNFAWDRQNVVHYWEAVRPEGFTVWDAFTTEFEAGVHVRLLLKQGMEVKPVELLRNAYNRFVIFIKAA